MTASGNGLDGLSCTFVHIIAVGLSGIHYARCLSVSVKGVPGYICVDSARNEYGGPDLRIFKGDGLIKSMDGML